MLKIIYYMQMYGQKKKSKPLLSIFSCNVQRRFWKCDLKPPLFPTITNISLAYQDSNHKNNFKKGQENPGAYGYSG